MKQNTIKNINMRKDEPNPKHFLETMQKIREKTNTNKIINNFLN
ncbi:hypothetical protein AMET1_0988 [Methanonatronarchaeum thermophilum]|uniref:Uncharacterized protein n=1 Tax=Methanonatronarchaeum thermophilum TaxID=1927129 RepID=A0A1Y3GCZ3_9EURY|nr:hypothetical protein AMET1_0988 [Methanonatronarchaeum thermophilum]